MDEQRIAGGRSDVDRLERYIGGEKAQICCSVELNAAVRNVPAAVSTAHPCSALDQRSNAI